MLTGPSGTGKTTLLRLLLRFTELTAGTARVGGTDLAAIPVEAWRAQIAWVPQHPRLFGGSVADNIALGRPDASRTAIEGAAARARLLPWIACLPQGWDTQVGVRGAAVSGGERQRLALARAFLANPALLILDEPTAHLDPATRQALTNDLLNATEGRSVLLITHELDGLDQVDHIVVLDHGKIAEQGTHQQLRRAGGSYQRMWEAGSDLSAVGVGGRAVTCSPTPSVHGGESGRVVRDERGGGGGGEGGADCPGLT
jgi:ABC-type multidrug transport system fused ATPase/permease subunit